jgi:hypothetical protein
MPKALGTLPAIDPQAKYTIATNSYLAVGDDGYITH